MSVRVDLAPALVRAPIVRAQARGGREPGGQEHGGQERGGQDFTIPPPRDPGHRADPAAAPGTSPQAAPRTEAGSSPFGGLERGATGTEVALGAAALAVLAVVFLFVRAAVRTHLINRRAALDAADGASWMLFSALMLTASVLVTAAVGRLWQFWAGLLAAFCLCLILFGAALVLFLRAPERRR